jgi:hypothetical protein
MVIERSKSEIIIKVPLSVNIDDIQDLVNFSRYKELSSTIHIAQKEIDILASEINSTWWNENRNRFIK